MELTTDVNVEKLKACLIVQGFEQKKGVDFEKTFAPTMKWPIIRIIVTMGSWLIKHINVKTTFLNGYLGEEVCMMQPQGFIILGRENQICELRRTIYRLKQVSKAWYARIYNFLQHQGLIKSYSYHNLYHIMKMANIWCSSYMWMVYC